MMSNASLLTAQSPVGTFAPDIDPVCFEVIRNDLLAITSGAMWCLGRR
jgi:hypothetical protein